MEWSWENPVSTNAKLHSAKSEHGFLSAEAPEVFYKKGVFKNFTKFPEKHLCQSLFFDQGNHVNQAETS